MRPRTGWMTARDKYNTSRYLGVQSDVAGLLELVPDERQRVDEVGMLAANTLTRQLRQCHSCAHVNRLVRFDLCRVQTICIKYVVGLNYDLYSVCKLDYLNVLRPFWTLEQ